MKFLEFSSFQISINFSRLSKPCESLSVGSGFQYFRNVPYFTLRIFDMADSMQPVSVSFSSKLPLNWREHDAIKNPESTKCLYGLRMNTWKRGVGISRYSPFTTLQSTWHIEK